MEYQFNSPEATFVKKFLNSTNQHIFLTGKAGTGKTTLLKELIKTTHKTTLIAAPTGIAAINAGGVTLHSLFHLPFGTFLPQDKISFSEGQNVQINTPKSLIKNLRMNDAKRKLIISMELLVIDEVSMLRADLLDAIDYVLRYIRKKRNIPFGGVQILFVGDLWQLPPIVKDSEKAYLNELYENYYFFNALALANNPPIYIELKHIFRQGDKNFTHLLNNFRTNNITSDDLKLLNKCYVQNIDHKKYEGYIFLTTHNYAADRLNLDSLNKLSGSSVVFNASIEGDFNENLYPIDYQLELKEEAQVMFVKNDTSGRQAFFNGKIGKVKALSHDYILVGFDDGSDDVEVELHVWENKRFSLNKESNEIEEKVIGRFVQYPLRLAWAITIHKSQGLTFEKAIIDISNVFAAGQAYVALSRLTSIEGLVLSKKASELMPNVDLAITQFAENKKDNEILIQDLNKFALEYAKSKTIETFDFLLLNNAFEEHLSTYDKQESRSAKQRQAEWARQLFKDFKEIKELASKFQNQLSSLKQSDRKKTLEFVQERLVAAKNYFEPKLQKLNKEIVNQIAKMNAEKGVKTYIRELKVLDNMVYKQILNIWKSQVLVEKALAYSDFDQGEFSKLIKTIDRPKADEEIVKKSKVKKDSANKSFELFLSGKEIDEVAEERGLAISTIEGHLSKYVRLGKIDVIEFVENDKIELIIDAINELSSLSLGSLKGYLGNAVSYSELRFVVNHFMYENNIATSEKHKND